MKKSFIGILTYRRLGALREMMRGIEEHCPHYPCVISEDCGQRDATADYLQAGRQPVRQAELMADEYVIGEDLRDANYLGARVYMGLRNLGVAGNSNRVIKLFLDSGADHLCLCNDDPACHG